MALGRVTALAQTNPAKQPLASPAPRLVVLESDVDPQLEETIAELLERLHVRLGHQDGTGNGRVVAHVWVEPYDSLMRVTVQDDRQGGLVIGRDVPRADSPELVRETVAHVILSAVEAVSAADPNSGATHADNSFERTLTQDGGSPGPPDQLAAPSGEPANARSFRWTLGILGGPRWLGPDHVGVSFSGATALALASYPRPAAILQAGYVLPVHTRAIDANGTFRMIPFRAGVRITPIAGERVALETSLSGGVDVASFEVTSTGKGVRAGPPTQRVQPTLAAALGVRVRVVSELDLVETTGLDMDIAPRRWILEHGAARDRLFETARVRPYTLLGLDFAVLDAKTSASKTHTP